MNDLELILKVIEKSLTNNLKICLDSVLTQLENSIRDEMKVKQNMSANENTILNVISILFEYKCVNQLPINMDQNITLNNKNLDQILFKSEIFTKTLSKCFITFRKLRLFFTLFLSINCLIFSFMNSICNLDLKQNAMKYNKYIYL